MPLTAHEQTLCTLYETFNRREYVHPDPLEFLYNYEDIEDREIVGLVASSLAYGQVRQILKSVSRVLERLESPRRFLESSSREALVKTFADFKHRFTTGMELAAMLYAVKAVLKRNGSLGDCFAAGHREGHETIIPALSAFVGELAAEFNGTPRSLLPSPDKGSACKRLNLFLRWMVRRDAVDPGGWDHVPAALLIVPLDVHMHRISVRLGLTQRKQADLRTACQITAAFRKIEPQDPVRYDFCLTRLGIRDDLDPDQFLKACGGDEQVR